MYILYIIQVLIVIADTLLNWYLLMMCRYGFVAIENSAVYEFLLFPVDFDIRKLQC